MANEMTIKSQMEFLLRKYVGWILALFQRYLNFFGTIGNSSSKLPAIKQPDIILQSATSLAKKIRNKELTSRAVIEAYIERIRDVNPILNAVVEDRFEAAVEEAKIVDRFISDSIKTPKQIEQETPLLGVPITVKECCRLAGMSYCAGAKLRAGIRAQADGAAVANMKNAGAIPLLVSNMPELGVSIETDNYITGRTNNPYDPVRSAGGSSGGEGALIGSAASVLGIGTDYAGSIRIPGLFNGIFGHKPTAGVVSNEGHYPPFEGAEIGKLLVMGPLARYAEDLILALKVMAGPMAATLKLDRRVSMKDLKVYYMTDFNFNLVNPSINEGIKNGILESARYLNEVYGCSTVRLHANQIRFFEDVSKICISHLTNVLDDKRYLDLKGQNESMPYIELLKYLCNASDYTFLTIGLKIMVFNLSCLPESIKEQFRKKRAHLQRTIEDLLGDNSVLIMPSFPQSAHYKYQYLLKFCFIPPAMIVNILGLPATQVPIGLDKNKLPIGFQVIAGPYQDRLCLAVARELEKFRGGWIPPPSLEL